MRLGVQGVLIGFAAEFLYEQDSRYAKSGSNRFGSKDRILVFRVGVMTVVSGVVTIGVPELIERSAAYPTVQMVAAAFTLGIVLVHCSSGNWKLRTEWPVLTDLRKLPLDNGLNRALARYRPETAISSRNDAE